MRSRTPWATLLRRVFDVDALACPRCLTPMVVLAFITDPQALARILGHLGLPTSPPDLAPARLPIEEEAPPLDDEHIDDLPGDEPELTPLTTWRLRPAPG